MAQGHSQYSDISTLIPDIFQAAMWRAREATVMPNLITVLNDRSGMVPRKIPLQPAYPTAQQVAEDEDYSNPTAFNRAASVTLTPYEYMVQAILSDQKLETDPEPAMADCTRWLGNGMADSMETNLLGLFSDFSLGVGSAGTTITVKYLQAAIAQLRNSVKNSAAQLYGVLHPYHWFALWNAMTQPAATYEFPANEVANQAMRGAFLGQFLGVTWFQHAGISVDASDDAYSAIFAREALALDIRRAPKLEPDRDASLRAWELNMTHWYAYGVRRSDHGCYLLFDAATPDGS